MSVLGCWRPCTLMGNLVCTAALRLHSHLYSDQAAGYWPQWLTTAEASGHLLSSRVTEMQGSLHWSTRAPVLALWDQRTPEPAQSAPRHRGQKQPLVNVLFQILYFSSVKVLADFFYSFLFNNSFVCVSFSLLSIFLIPILNPCLLFATSFLLMVFLAMGGCFIMNGGGSECLVHWSFSFNDYNFHAIFYFFLLKMLLFLPHILNSGIMHFKHSIQCR